MQSQKPSIFRSLETEGRRSGFDTIVTAALQNELRRGGQRKLRDEVAELIDATWNQLSEGTRHHIAASIPADWTIPARLGERLAAVVPVARQDGAAPAGVEEPEGSAPADIRSAAELLREELRSLAGRSARRPHRPSAHRPLASTEDLLLAARRGENLRVLVTIAKRTGQSMDALVGPGDESGELLACALHGMAMPVADAMTLVMLLRPLVGTSVPLFEDLRRAYESWGTETGGVPFPAPAAAAERMPERRANTQEPGLVRPTPHASRRAFGRRAQPPAPAGRTGSESA